MQFSPDGNFLFTGARQDSQLLCWDVRYTSDVVYRLQRSTAATNQRIQFDVEPCGRHLITGGSDSCVLAFDLRTGEEVQQVQVAGDTVNGCTVHPYLPLLATASGVCHWAWCCTGWCEGSGGASSWLAHVSVAAAAAGREAYWDGWRSF